MSATPQLWRCAGPDALDFLQRQLTADLSQLSSDRSLGAALLSPKGKVLALLTVVLRDQESAWLIIDQGLAEPTFDYLNRFRFRSTLSFSPESDYGLSFEPDLGDDSRFDFLPTTRSDSDQTAVVSPLGRLAIGRGWSDANVSLRAWQQAHLDYGLIPFANDHCDRFVPGLLNLDWLGYLAFDKGCYPGQEIVARTRHLGRIKRRLFIVEWLSDPSELRSDQTWTSSNQQKAQIVAGFGHRGLALAPLDAAGDRFATQAGHSIRLRLPAYAPKSLDL